MHEDNIKVEQLISEGDVKVSDKKPDAVKIEALKADVVGFTDLAKEYYTSAEKAKAEAEKYKLKFIVADSELADAEADRDRLREAAIALMEDMPQLSCEDFHHVKADQHNGSHCVVENRHYSALAHLRKALK